jgi:hypothetical protein
MDVQVRVEAGAVVVPGLLDPRRHEVERVVADAALAGDQIGEAPDRARRPAQHRHLQAGIVVQVDLQAGDAEVVVRVLLLGQALR